MASRPLASASTAEVARRLCSLTLAAVPAEVVAAAKLHLLDALGVGLAALRSRPELAPGLAAFGAPGESTVLGQERTRSAGEAALINGMLIHSLEFDDTHIASVIHGSAVVLPAALAVAEREDASGAELLAAVIAGWELLIRLGLASPGGFQAAGFQTVAVAGPFAAALVAARLSGGGEKAAANALGIALSQAGGTFEFLADGASVKAMHPGWSALAGIAASDLAAIGVTGPSSPFAGRFGLFRCFADDPEAGAAFARATAELGEAWLLPEVAFKLHPCCHYIHSFLECGERLLASGLLAAEIESLLLRVPAEEAAVICEPWPRKQRPPSDYDARFSLPLCLGAVLAGRDLDAAGFAGIAADEDARGLARRMRWEPWTGSGFPARFPAAVEVTTKDGRSLRAEVDDVRGAPGRPLAEGAVRAKFSANAVPLLGEEVAARLESEVMTIERRPSRAIGELLRAPRGGPAEAHPRASS